LAAVNHIECFKYRIAEDNVYIYDQINASPSEERADETLVFLNRIRSGLCSFEKKISETERIQTTTGLFTRTLNTTMLFISRQYLVKFYFTLACKELHFPDSCPKISFGKMMTTDDGTKTMAMSIHVHHGLIDGLQLVNLLIIFKKS
jgi:chloramphenicol O-acetyltransferase type A